MSISLYMDENVHSASASVSETMPKALVSLEENPPMRNRSYTPSDSEPMAPRGKIVYTSVHK